MRTVFCGLLISFLLFIFNLSCLSQSFELWGTTNSGGKYNAGTIFKTDDSGLNESKEFDFHWVGGELPKGSLIEASNGVFYGLTTEGGSSSDGILFSYNPITEDYRVEFEFDSWINGNDPRGTLMEASDGLLYGMTYSDDPNNAGILFSFDYSNGTFTEEFEFGFSNGKNPIGKLVEASDGRLYGVTENGGSVDRGVLFSYEKASNSFFVEHTFTGFGGDSPKSSLTLGSDGKLYGTTVSGGNNNDGVLFAYDVVSDAFNKLHDFEQSTGENPMSSVIQASNGLFYGMCRNGGSNFNGVIFSYDPVSQNYNKIFDFNGTNGRSSRNGFVLANDGLLYGMTYSGGIDDKGVLFSFDFTTNSYQKQIDFNNTIGAFPHGELIQSSDGRLYGLTNNGQFGRGNLFSFDTSTEQLEIEFWFDESLTGKNSSAKLLEASNGYLYGTTRTGGEFKTGVLFSYDPILGVYDTLLSFGGNNGKIPHDGLIEVNGVLYGLTNRGGSNNDGVLYSFDLSANQYSVEFEFDETTFGRLPKGRLLLASDGLLYGTTELGGLNNYGVIFSFDINSQQMTVEHDFNNIDGAYPWCSLIESDDGKLYGISSYGGSDDDGVIFSYDITNNMFAVEYELTGTDGRGAYTGLVEANNGLMYGVTVYGGANNQGVLFSFNKNTDTYSKLIDFDGATNGGRPSAELIQAPDGILYGVTSLGGGNNMGTLFSYDISLNSFSKKIDFNDTIGAGPNALIAIETCSDNTGTDVQTACDSYTWIDGNTYNSSNNTATHTLTNVAGCDSVVTLDLTINSSTIGTDVQTACDSYTWIDGNTYTSSNNTATHTLTNAAGCDSVVTLDLTILNSTTGTDVQTACDSYTWIDGNTYTSDNNTATHTLTNVAGCDSVVTLDITILNSTTGSDVQTACDSYTWIDGNTYTSSNNTATHTLANAAGCDSVVTLDLTILNSTTGTDVQTACDSYTWIDGNTYTSSNNTATHTLTNAAGCDSVVTLDLTILNSTTGTDVQTACDSYTWIDGNTYTSSNNTATHTLTNAAGCDSVVTLDLTILNSTTGTDVQTACDSYTWIDGNTYTSSNNSATHTLTNAAGCDSVVTLDLTILNSTTGTDVQTACDSYTWIDGNTYTSSNNTATHTLTNAAGCDSVVTLDLAINSSTTGIDVQTACDSYTWIDGNTYTSSNSTATYTLTNAAGCDSVVTLDLTILNSTTGTDVQTACDSYTWIDGNTYTSSNNSATHTLTNAAGCDSVVTLDLTILNSTTGTDVQTACDSYTWIDGNIYTSDNNTATHTLTNVAGCDSVVTLDLTINNSTSGTDQITACNPYTWIDGNTYTSSNNTATHTLTNTVGCDSVVTLDLTINSVDNGVTVTNDTELNADQTGADYQWLDCDNNFAPMSGETNQQFVVSTNGNYAVEVTINNCSDTSDCIEISDLKIGDQSPLSEITVYPNPTEGKVNIDLGAIERATIELSTIEGKVLQRKKISNPSALIDIKAPKGLFIIKISSKGEERFFKVVKM